MYRREFQIGTHIIRFEITQEIFPPPTDTIDWPKEKDLPRFLVKLILPALKKYLHEDFRSENHPIMGESLLKTWGEERINDDNTVESMEIMTPRTTKSVATAACEHFIENIMTTLKEVYRLNTKNANAVRMKQREETIANWESN